METTSDGPARVAAAVPVMVKIDVKELAPGRPRTPQGNGRRARNPGVVHPADHRGEDVGVLEPEVVPGAIEIGGHHGDEVRPILPVIGLTKFDSGDLGDGVGFVRAVDRKSVV